MSKMKVINIILVCMLTLVGCQFLTYRLVAHAQEVVIEPLSTPEFAPLPDRRGYSTLPGWSAGYRLHLDLSNFDYYDDDQGKLRLFGKYKSTMGNIVKFGIDGSTDSAVLFLEQEFKF